MPRKRKPNSIRAMRELRGRIRELESRLAGATRDRDRGWLADFDMPSAMVPFLKAANRLGYTVECYINHNGHLRCDAVKRRFA